MGGVRKSVNFNVSQEAYEKVKEIFPEVIGTEDNLLQLVTAYKFWCEHKDDVPGADSAEIEKLRADLRQAELERDQKQAEIDRLKQDSDTYNYIIAPAGAYTRITFPMERISDSIMQHME